MKKKLYKIVCCNLGYEDLDIFELNNYVGSFEEVMGKIEELHLEDWKEIDGITITKINLKLKEGDFKNDEAINVVETEDYNRCIYVCRENFNRIF